MVEDREGGGEVVGREDGVIDLCVVLCRLSCSKKYGMFDHDVCGIELVNVCSQFISSVLGVCSRMFCHDVLKIFLLSLSSPTKTFPKSCSRIVCATVTTSARNDQ